MAYPVHPALGRAFENICDQEILATRSIVSSADRPTKVDVTHPDGIDILVWKVVSPHRFFRVVLGRWIRMAPHSQQQYHHCLQVISSSWHFPYGIQYNSAHTYKRCQRKQQQLLELKCQEAHEVARLSVPLPKYLIRT